MQYDDIFVLKRYPDSVEYALGNHQSKEENDL